MILCFIISCIILSLGFKLLLHYYYEGISSSVRKFLLIVHEEFLYFGFFLSFYRWFEVGGMLLWIKGGVTYSNVMQALEP